LDKRKRMGENVVVLFLFLFFVCLFFYFPFVVVVLDGRGCQTGDGKKIGVSTKQFSNNKARKLMYNMSRVI